MFFSYFLTKFHFQKSEFVLLSIYPDKNMLITESIVSIILKENRFFLIGNDNMKLFRKDSNYAVRTLVYIARQNQSGPISSTHASQALGIPINFLRRIFSILIQSGILKGKEGARGGVMLGRPPSQINVWEVIQGLQGDIKICNSNHDNELCRDRDVCVMRKRIVEIEKLIVREFRKITIQTLIDDTTSMTASQS